MTEKRYYRDFSGNYGTIIRDRKTDEEVFEFGLSDSKDLCDLLNEQEETIQNQKEYNLLLEQKLEENGIRLEPKDYD